MCCFFILSLYFNEEKRREKKFVFICIMKRINRCNNIIKFCLDDYL